jgi:hypothetical protein
MEGLDQNPNVKPNRSVVAIPSAGDVGDPADFTSCNLWRKHKNKLASRLGDLRKSRSQK